MNTVAKINPAAVTAEQVLIGGDLKSLGEAERVKYYADVCHSVGLNPLTKPFEYITLNGKLRLYALKDCTDQLRSIHHVSVTDMTETEREGVFIVTVKVMDKTGRTDIAKGAVNIANLKGEVLANALMKAETKAKRRATLSICGLGLLDETEVEDIPAQQKAAFRVPSPPPVEVVKDDPLTPVELVPFKDESIGTWCGRFIESLEGASNLADANTWLNANKKYLDLASQRSKKAYAIVLKAIEEKERSFQPKTDPISSGPQPRVRMGTSGPDIDTDYEGWLEWARLQINSAESISWLDAFCETEIDPHERALFPPDYNDLQEAVGQKQSALTPKE